MKIVIVTQNDIFYLPESVKILLNNLPGYASIGAAVILQLSPFSKNESFLKKSIKILRIFGPKYFVRNGLKYLSGKLFGADVRKVFSGHNIPIINIDGDINSKESMEKIKHYNPSLIISIGSNQIFRKPLIDIATQGIINLHSSLLPKYRGAMPTFWVLKNKEKFTGVSVYFVDKGIDSGPILVQKSIPIGKKSQEELIITSKKIGMEAIIESIELIKQGSYKLKPNDDSNMSYYSFPDKNDVKEFRKLGNKFY